MATLFQTSSQVRRILLFVLIGIAVILIVDNVSRFLSSPYNPFGTKLSYYLASDTNLGKIPTPPMSSLTIGPSSQPTFTIEGALATFPDTALVYTIEMPHEKLDTLEKATATAATLGFTDAYAAVSQDEVSWSNSANTRTLIFNKATQQWKLRTKYVFDAAALTPKTLNPTLDNYINAGLSIASRLGFTDKSLLQGTVVPQFAILGADGLFTHPFDQASANYVSLDVFRSLQFALPKDIHDLPSSVKQSDLPSTVNGLVYKIEPLCYTNCAPLHMIVSNKATDLKADVFELDFTDFIYSYTNYTVREIITPAEAWDNIRQNKGALVQLRLDTADYYSLNQTLNVTKFAADATKTEVGYFEPDPWDGFVYPIYIFHGRAETDKGNANFTFFVDAQRRF